MIPVPVLTPRLSSLWLGLVTPVHARVGRALVESLRNDTIVRDPRRSSAFPIRPRTVAEAIARALRNEDREFAETRWSDEAGAADARFGGRRLGSRLVDVARRSRRRRRAPAFAPIRRIGGRIGLVQRDARCGRLRGAARLARRRRRACAAGAATRTAARRRHDRLLARRGVRAGPPAAPARRDAASRPRLAAVRGRPGDGGGSTITQTAIFDPDGRRRPRLLVRDLGRSTVASSRECSTGSRAPPSRRDPLRRPATPLPVLSLDIAYAARKRS